MRLLSDDRTRVIDDEPIFGIAAYEGGMVNDTWQGYRVGLFANADDAERWLSSGEPKPLNWVLREGRA